MDYYAILGVHPTAEDIVIRAAFKALAQRYHPDRYTGAADDAHRRMSDLTKAYEVLADPARRKKYDRRRLMYTQSVATYFSGAPKPGTLEMDIRDLRVTATKRKRSRVALSALLIAVVVLSAFNLVQYSAQIKEMVASLPASSPADPAAPRSREIAASGVVGAASLDASPESSAKARIAPIAQGSANVPPAPTAAASVAPQSHAEPVVPEARHATGPVAPMPQPLTTEPAHAAAAAAILLPPTLSPAEARQPNATPTSANIAPVERTPTPSPVATPASDPCREAVAALGLCTPPKTARNN